MTGADSAESSPTPSNYLAWLSAYTTAQVPIPKSREVIEALEHVLVYGHGNARATAAVNGGVFDEAVMRRLAAVEVAKDTFQRIAAGWDDLSDHARAVILGTKGKVYE